VQRHIQSDHLIVEKPASLDRGNLTCKTKLEHDYNKRTPHPLYAKLKPLSCVLGEIRGGTYATATASQCALRGCVYFSPGLGSIGDIMDAIRNYIENGTQHDPWFESHPVKTVFLRHKNTAVIDEYITSVKTLALSIYHWCQ
jgi:hypothetical protein